jgi:hypothetical protein
MREISPEEITHVPSPWYRDADCCCHDCRDARPTYDWHITNLQNYISLSVVAGK